MSACDRPANTCVHDWREAPPSRDGYAYRQCSKCGASREDSPSSNELVQYARDAANVAAYACAGNPVQELVRNANMMEAIAVAVAERERLQGEVKQLVQSVENRDRELDEVQERLQMAGREINRLAHKASDEPRALRPGLERAIEILSKTDCYTAHGARDSGLAFADINTEHVKAFRDHVIDKLDAAIGASVPPPAAPVAWRKFIDSAYERHPRYHLREDTGIGAPEGWEPLYASPPRRPEPPDASRESEYLDALREIAGYLGPLDSTAELMRQCVREALPSETKEGSR